MAEGKGATLQIQAPSHQKSGKWKNGKIGGLCENRTRRHPKYCKKVNIEEVILLGLILEKSINLESLSQQKLLQN